MIIVIIGMSVLVAIIVIIVTLASSHSSSSNNNGTSVPNPLSSIRIAQDSGQSELLNVHVSQVPNLDIVGANRDSCPAKFASAHSSEQLGVDEGPDDKGCPGTIDVLLHE